MSLSPGKGQLVPPEGTAPVLLHRPTRSLSSNVVQTQLSAVAPRDGRDVHVRENRPDRSG